MNNNTSFDMNQCKPGDKLVTKHGTIMTYITKHTIDAVLNRCPFPHIVQYPSGSYGSRTNDGHVYASKSKRMPGDEDIVGFAAVTVDDPIAKIEPLRKTTVIGSNAYQLGFKDGFNEAITKVISAILANKN